MEYIFNKMQNTKINEAFNGKAPPVTIDQTKIILSQLQKNLCKIYKIDETKGTAFFCKVPFPDQFHLLHTLITANHILNKEDLKFNKTIELYFDDNKIKKTLLIDQSRIIFTSEELDVSIIEIKPELDEIYYFLDIDENIYEKDYNDFYKNKPIYILQYPKGLNASFKVDLIKEINNINIEHFCSTNFGSSGSPILSFSNYKVIGIHTRRTIYNYNEGTFIKFVIEEFNKLNPNQIIAKEVELGKSEEIIYNEEGIEYRPNKGKDVVNISYENMEKTEDIGEALYPKNIYSNKPLNLAIKNISSIKPINVINKNPLIIFNNKFPLNTIYKISDEKQEIKNNYI